jgi:hypothetical protein
MEQLTMQRPKSSLVVIEWQLGLKPAAGRHSTPW